MVGLNLHIYRDQAVLSLDSSGESLHKRGYRPILTKAPLNEALAAALVLLTGWRGETPFVDPLCGSGLLPIEAAWMALRRPPGLTRKRFGFQGWMDYDVRSVDGAARRGAARRRRDAAGADPRLRRARRCRGLRDRTTPAPPASAICSASTSATCATSGRRRGRRA